MAGAFAALESRVNDAVFAHLCNAVASVNGTPVDAIFDNGYSAGSVGIVGVASTQPTLSVATAFVPTNPVGLNAVVNGTTYTIAAHEPDGTGSSLLILERTA